MKETFAHLYQNPVKIEDGIVERKEQAMKLYLIRHGESVGNTKNIIQGQSDYPLSSLGQEQAKQLGNYFKHIHLDSIYSSGLSRAFVTAQTLADEKGMVVQEWESIREIGLGPFQGKTRAEIEAMFPVMKDRPLLTSGIEGTETVAAITKRCAIVWEQLKHEHETDSVAIVSHGGFIGIFMMYLMFGDDWDTMHRPFQVSNTGVTLVNWQAMKKPMFEYINSTTHLEIAALQAN